MYYFIEYSAFFYQIIQLPQPCISYVLCSQLYDLSIITTIGHLKQLSWGMIQSWYHYSKELYGEGSLLPFL